ncbi:hypothetical protein EV186_102490 [Labedaea rhizosphaerae]|uniref:Uncharacterized protein n=2 Tax=Labedaea rhizosphaerae TaxID=598644 RepID=A0A4R6SID0_LABRH|nr:hypothetical protein EV186_102490 [Labedaea rhizosphaerae]
MHNPPAATTIVKGEVADSLLPSDDFNDCTLNLHRADKLVPDYTMAIGVDAVDQDTIQQGQPLQIAGLNFYSRQQTGTNDEHETSPCVVYLPQSDGYALYLQVEPPIDPVDGAMHVCDVAVAYLKATAERWRTPPTRAEHRTDPALDLAAADPCAATGILTALGGGRVAHADLHQCLYASPRQSTDGTGAGAPLKMVDVRYELDSPDTLTGDDDATYKQAAIAGMPVAQHDSHSATQGCLTLFRIGSVSVTIDENSSEPPWVQIVEVTAPTCALSSQAAAAVISTVR